MIRKFSILLIALLVFSILIAFVVLPRPRAQVQDKSPIALANVSVRATQASPLLKCGGCF
jgi:hypothetical protein